MAQGGVGYHVVAVEGRVEVAGELIEAFLEVDDQEELKSEVLVDRWEWEEKGEGGAYGVVLVEALEGDFVREGGAA